jgi:hypothetical protein
MRSQAGRPTALPPGPRWMLGQAEDVLPLEVRAQGGSAPLKGGDDVFHKSVTTRLTFL